MPGRSAAARVTGVDLEEHLVRLLGRATSAGCAMTVIRSCRCSIRRRGPGAARRGALLALLYLRGEDGLDAEDLAVVRWLIRIKAARDVPYAFDACFNSWLAVRGGD